MNAPLSACCVCRGSQRVYGLDGKANTWHQHCFEDLGRVVDDLLLQLLCLVHDVAPHASFSLHGSRSPQGSLGEYGIHMDGILVKSAGDTPSCSCTAHILTGLRLSGLLVKKYSSASSAGSEIGFQRGAGG